MNDNLESEAIAIQGLVSLTSWLQQVGITACTAWRWRKKGWLKVTNICGRLYLSQADIKEFVERAQRGEFAKEHKVPDPAAGKTRWSYHGLGGAHE